MFKIEKEFEYKGYPCYCIMQNHAHRLGYVGVSKSNSLFECIEKQLKKLADQLSEYEKEENEWENI